MSVGRKTQNLKGLHLGGGGGGGLLQSTCNTDTNLIAESVHAGVLHIYSLYKDTLLTQALPLYYNYS